jgi:hypothetical protein
VPITIVTIAKYLINSCFFMHDNSLNSRTKFLSLKFLINGQMIVVIDRSTELCLQIKNDTFTHKLCHFSQIVYLPCRYSASTRLLFISNRFILCTNYMNGSNSIYTIFKRMLYPQLHCAIECDNMRFIVDVTVTHMSTISTLHIELSATETCTGCCSQPKSRVNRFWQNAIYKQRWTIWVKMCN